MTTQDRTAEVTEATTAFDPERSDLVGVVRRLVVMINQQQAELANLHEAVATLDGRTQRHEAGQDQSRTVGGQIADLAERVEQESTLRRALVAALERQAGQDHDERAALVKRGEQLAEQIELLQSRLTSDQARSGRVAAGFSEQAQQELSLGDRLSALEQQLTATGQELRLAREERARAETVREQTQATLDQLTERAQAAENAWQRLEQELASLRPAGDRERELRELVEQQRTSRTRTEERVAAFEADLHQTKEGLAEATEERLILQQQLNGDRQRLATLALALDEQREAIIDHFQRWTAVSSKAGKREVEEIERASREARDLLVRLTEGADHSAQEQPL
jgi:chromosome segregation ATPase